MHVCGFHPVSSRTEKRQTAAFPISSPTAKSLTEGLLNDDVLKAEETGEIKELRTDGNLLKSAYMERKALESVHGAGARGPSVGF